MPALTPTSPGEILKEEFMGPHDINANQLAGALGVPANRVTQIIKGTRGITSDTALRLARAFDTTPEFWLNLQSRYDLELTTRSSAASIRKSVKRVISRRRSTSMAQVA